MKEAYITMRNKQELNNNWLWQYYKMNGGVINNPQEFIDYFYNDEVPIKIKGKVIGYEKVPRDLSQFFHCMDKVFNLTTLWGVDNNFIKVVI